MTGLCFVSFDEKIYIFFELLGLTLICKELALLACTLTLVYLLHTPAPRKKQLSEFCSQSNYDHAV